MMLEEAGGYNPFVEGEVPEPPPTHHLPHGHSFLESDFSYGAHGRRLSFIEHSSSLPVVITPPASSSPATPTKNNSPSLKVVVPAGGDETNDNNTNELDNPFVNEPLSLDDASSSSPSATLSLPPTSPLIRMSSERLSLSPHLSPRSEGRRSSSPRLPSSPLASSSPSDPNSFAFQQRSVVSVEKAEWVPDSHSNVCEHCDDVFTFIRRRHHCRVCGHLFCGECMIKTTLPAALGFASAQKSCVRCAYRVIRTRGNFSCSIPAGEDLPLTQKLAGKVQNLVYRVGGMYDGGKFDRHAAQFATPSQFSLYQTDFFSSSKNSVELEKEFVVPSHHDASTLKATAYVPKGDGPYSILVYIPGGSFVLSSDSGVASFCKELCCKVGCIVVAVSYRLAPEYKFPTQWEDCYSVVKWVYESAMLDLPKIEKDPKIAVCGEGAGGLLAAAVCQMARDRGSPPIRFQLLITPWLNITTLNVDKFEESYVVTKDLMKWVPKQVFSDYGDRDKQYVSPLLASSFANLPSTKIITAGHDPLHFDAEEYGNELRKGGANVSVTRYENSMHGFVGIHADAHSELEEAVYEVVVSLREAFGRGEPLGAHNTDSS